MTSAQGTSATGSIETEWQFEVDDLEGVRAWLESQPAHAPLRFALRKDAEQVDSYYDTADWRLFYAGYSLRRRRREGTFEVTLKSLERAAEGPISRREINEESPDGEIPGEGGPVSDRVRAIAGRARLERLFEVRTWRRSYSVRQGTAGDETTVAQVELDETTVAAPSVPATTFRRVEVETTSGAPSPDLESFVQSMRYANQLEPTTTSKFEAGLLAASLDPVAALDFGATQRTATSDTMEYAYACLREHWAAFLRHAPGTRLGEDIEALHQMRVATRRLRAAIQVFAAVLPGAFEGYRTELQWVGHELGAVRDLDVQIDGLETLSARSSWEDAAALRPLISVIAEERSAERARLLDLLDSDRYDALVEEFSRALRLDSSESRAGDEGAGIGVFARPVLERRFERLRRDGRLLGGGSAPAEYHALRIRGKRLRYSLELFGPLYGRRAARATDALKSVQDLLGDHQDAEVGGERLHAIVREHGRELPPETLVAIGTLIERYRSHAGELRSAVPEVFDSLLSRWRPLARSVAAAAQPARASRIDAPPVMAGSASDAEETDDGPSGGRREGTDTAEATPPRAETSSAPRDASIESPAVETAPRTSASPRAPWSPSRPAPARDSDESGSLSRMRHLFRRD